MATRAECDEFYRWAGYEQGFDVAVPTAQVLARALELPEAQAGQVRRAAAVAAMGREASDAYFEISEHATSAQAVEAVTGDPARAGVLVLALLPTWSDNPDRPLSLHVLPRNGGVHRRLAADHRAYGVTPIRLAGGVPHLPWALRHKVGNLPQERIQLLLARATGWLYHPRSLLGRYTADDLLPCPPGWGLPPWLRDWLLWAVGLDGLVEAAADGNSDDETAG